MASSQGQGAYNHSANHPVGRSQMRQRAPSSLLPEDETALKTVQSKEEALHARRSPGIPEVQPFLQIACSWSAHKTPILGRFADRDVLRPAGEPQIPAVRSGGTLHRRGETPPARPDGWPGLENQLPCPRSLFLI